MNFALLSISFIVMGFVLITEPRLVCHGLLCGFIGGCFLGLAIW